MVTVHRQGPAVKQRLTTFVGVFLLAIASASAGFAQQTNQALLIGNAVYPDADRQLKEPVTDARALGDELRRRGFDVTIGENLKKQALQQALDQFYAKIHSGSTAVIFFSGFGIQSDRQTYLIPVDAQIWNENDVRRDGFSLDKILAEMTNRGAEVKVAIIDGSRRNPFERRFRSAAAGLAAVAAPRGTVVMMSAPPDAVVDTTEPVFMTKLLTELKAPDATIEQTFNRTRVAVSRETKGQQVPWFSSSLDQDVTLGSATAAIASTTVQPTASSSTAPSPAPSKNTGATTSPDPDAQARHDYVVAENTGTKKAWDDFVAKYPSGYYYDLAQQQITKLTPSDKSTADAPTDLAGFYRRGQNRAVHGDYKLAADDFTEVIKRNPKHAGALNNRCWVRALIADLQDALRDCNAALRIAPNYPDARDSRGLVNLKLGFYDKAIADYDAALELDPKHASALYGRGIAKRRNGSVTGGDRDIEAAKAIKSEIADEFAGYGIK